MKESPFSEHCNRLTLANELGAYFKKKISDNRFELNAAATVHNCSTLIPPTSSFQPSSSSGFFSSFELLSKVSVKKLWIPVSLKSSPCMLTQIHQIRNYFPKRNHVLLSNFFSSSNMLFIRLFLANTWEKNRGSPCLFPHKLLWKVDMVLRSQSGWIICAAGTGARNKITPIVFDVQFDVCTRDQACFRLFLCVWYRQHRNSNLKRLH